ncbi:hypothetical protein J7L48_00770, partial [bacterium]|nr:hypothetical protein [bacterium]
VLLHERKMMFNLGLRFPEYFKDYNGMTGKIEDVNPNILLNESYFNGLFTYGLSDNFNIYGIVPIVNIHHYSPMIFKEGVGLGDIKIGGDYQLVKLKENNPDYAMSIEIKFSFPTGQYDDLTASDYPTGRGNYGIGFFLNSVHMFNTANFLWTAYYDYRTDYNGIQSGDETGLFLIMQHPFNTSFGNFGIEYGSHLYYKFADEKGGIDLPNSEDYSVDFYLGGWYEYLDDFYFHFGVPHSLYQNGEFFTKYQIIVQFDYLIN